MVDLVCVERPTFEEFLSSVRGVMSELRAATRATASEPATEASSAVLVEALVAPVVAYASTASVYLDKHQ